MIYYHRYPADYAIGAGSLSMIEDGAYGRLMDFYYGKEEPIEHARRYNIARATSSAEKKAVDTVLALFFTREGDSWRHHRIDDEIAKAQPRIEAARLNGKRGGRPKKKPNKNPLGSDNKTQRDTQQEPGGKASHTSVVNNSVGNTSTSEQTEVASSAEAREMVFLCQALKRVGMLDAGIDRPEILRLVRAGHTAEKVCMTAARHALREAELLNDPDVHPDLLQLFAGGASEADMYVTRDQFRTMRASLPTLQYLTGTVFGQAADEATRQRGQTSKTESKSFKDQNYGTASLDDLDPEYRAAAERHLPG